MLFQFEKFLPNSFKGSSIAFTYSHVERIDKPRYVANTDVDVESAVRQVGDTPGIDPVTAQRRADSLRQASQTLVVQDGFSFRNLKIAFLEQHLSETEQRQRASRVHVDGAVILRNRFVNAVFDAEYQVEA